MLSSQGNEPATTTTTQTSVPSPERAFRIETSFRISTVGVAIAACVVILLLLTVALYAGFNAMLRPLVMLLGVVAAFASLLSRGHIRVRSRRTADPPDDVRDLPDDIRAMLPEGAKKVYDLKDLPPDLANNPEVRRLFERAGARGAWVKIDSPGHSSVAAPDSVAGRAESALSGDPGYVEPAKVEKRVTRMTFRVSANSDTYNQASDVDWDGTSATAASKKIEPVAFEPGFTSFLNRAVVWAAFIVIVAALAAAVVAWMSLKAGSPAH